jgi:hypothetical protein
MRGGAETDSAKAATASLDHRLQHLFDRRAQGQIGVPDNAGADLGPAVGAARRRRGDTVGELDLADRAQLDWALGAVHRQPFEIDGRGDVVTVACVGEQFGQQVAAGFGSLDQMMMWVDDRQIGLDDLLAAAVEPVRPDRQMRAGRSAR